MYKTLTRLLCIGLILVLSIPLVACDQLLGGGLIGELINSTTPDPEPLPESDVLQDHTDKDTFSPDFESEIATHAPDETLTGMTTEYTTEPPTTEPSTTEPPIVDELPIQVIAAKSLDYLKKLPPQDTIFEGSYDALEWEKNPIATVDHLTDSLEIFGWVAFYTATEGTVGYSINGRDVIYNESFTYAAETGVQDHVTANVPGAQSACRMKFQIPTAELDAGDYTVQLVAKDPDGNEELLCKFTLIKTMPYQVNVHTAYSFDTLFLNDKMYFTEDGGASYKIDAQNKTVTILPDQEKGSIKMRGWAAFADAPAVEYGYYIGDEIVIVTDPSFLMERPDLAAAGIQNGTGFTITVPLSDVPAGIHPVGLIAKMADGTYAQLYSFYVKIVPETEPQTVVLGVRDINAVPFCGNQDKFGQKIPLNEAFLQQITINNLGTYSDGCNNTWSLKIWQWNIDYNSTVAGTPLFEITGKNHPDCANFVVDVPIELLICGDIYYELEYLSGSGSFTGWTATDVVYGVEAYVNGALREDNYTSSIVVGLVP